MSRRLLLIWLLCVIAGTLAPFHFVAMPGRVFAYGAYERDPIDFVLNLLLFVPLGASLRHDGRDRALASRALVLPVALFAAALSLTVEYCQAFLPVRDSSMLDVAANTGGALIGIAWDNAWGPSIAARLGRWRAATSPARLSALVGGLLMVALMISAVLQHRASLINWSAEYPLLIGNELTGDRAWQGRVVRLSVFDAATTPGAVRRFSLGEAIGPVGTQIAGFDFGGSPPFKDATGHLPAMEWIVPVEPSSGLDASLDGTSWLRSDGPASRLAQRLQQTSAFTLLVVCATDDTGQGGPARIVSNSVSPLLRNFTLGQQGRDLVFRLRTPATGLNGYPLEVSVPGMFSDRNVHQILVSYDGANLLVAMAHRDQISRTEFSAGGTVASALSSLNVQADELHMYQLAYVAILVLLPAVAVGVLGHTTRDRRTIGAAWVVVFALLLEVTLVRSSGRAFDWGNVAVTTAIAGAVFTAVAAAFSQPDLRWRQSDLHGNGYRTT